MKPHSLRSLFHALVGTVMLAAGGVQAQTYYNFGTASPGDATPTTNGTNVAGSAVSRGNNNGTTNAMLGTTSASSGYTGASGSYNAGAAARTGALNTGASGSAYFEFTLTPQDSATITVTEISFGTRSTSTAPQAFSIRSDADAYASDIATGTIANNSTWSLKTSGPLSVEFSSARTFRIYGHSGTGSASTNTTNWRIDDLSITSSSSGPNPLSPTIASIAPTTGWDGTVVTVTGTNFTGATAVSFNGAAAASFTVDSATQISATAPTGVTTGKISVTTPEGTAISVDDFTAVNPNIPTIASIAPTTGWEGTVVTVTGTNFTGATAVSFNGAAAASFTVDSATQISATAPTGVTTGKISVTTPEGTAISVDDFTAVNPNTLTVAVTLSPVSESATNPATTGTVTRAGPLTSSAITVTLTSSNPSSITVPGTVEFAADQLVANFDVTVIDNGIPDGNRTITLTATASGYTDGSTTIDVTDDGTDTWPLVINQYYEGASSDKYIEIKNISANPVELSEYRLTNWNNAARENWKTNTGSPTNNNVFAAFSLPAGATFLIKGSTAAANPPYAASGANATMSAAGGFNGDDSVVLYYSSVSVANIVDAVGFAANDGQDKTFYRISTAQGFDLNPGSSILDYPTVWANDKTLADVASAAITDEWYLKPYSPPLPPSLDTFVLGAGSATTSTGRVTLNFTASGGNAAEYRVSEASDFTGASWQSIGTGLTFDLSAGDGEKTVYFQLQNTDGTSAVLSDTIEVLTPSYEPSVLITQYYDPTESPAPNDKYIELTNTTDAPIDLTGWTLVRFTNQEAELYKITGATLGVSASINLTSIGTLAAGQTVVVANSGAAALTPPAALTSGNLNHNGNDSYALYAGPYGTEFLVDAIGFTNLGNEGVDKSFVRQTNAQGYSFAAGSNVTGFPAVWQEVSLATVAAAASNQNEFLGTYPGGGPPPPSGFSAWIAGFYPGETDPLIVGQNADPDKDGRSNLVEAYTGGLPNVAEGSPVSGMSKSGNTFVFYIQKAKTPVAGLTGSYEWSTGLGTWNASGASEGGVTVTIAESEFPWDDTAPGYDLYEVTATAAPGAPDELFIRLVVED